MRCSPYLTRLLGASLLVAAACNGEVAEDDPGPLENVLCEAPITVSGTFTSSITPAPTAAMGCVPDGRWTITATVPSNNGCSSVDVAAQYVFDVVNLTPGSERPNRKVELMSPPAGAEVDGAIHAGGNGECLLGVDITTPAETAGQFKVVTLKAYIDAVDGGTRTIMASSESSFQLWKQHP